MSQSRTLRSRLRVTRIASTWARPISFSSALGAALFSLGCGGEAPLAKAPDAPAAKPLAVAKERVDVSEVPAPKGLIVDGRVSNPAKVIGVANEWVAREMPNLPKISGTELATLILDENVGDIFDLAQPIDFAVTIDMSGRESYAVSFPLRAFDNVKAALEGRFTLASLENGAFKLDPPKRAKPEKKPKRPIDVDDEDEEEPIGGLNGKACVVTPAAGAAAFRLVCSRKERMLSDVVPYLTRTVPRHASSSDFHLEVHPEPMREAARRFGPMAIAGASSFVHQAGGGPATDDLVRAFVGEVQDLTNDLESITIDTAFADSGIEPVFKVAFKGNASLVSRIALAERGKDDVPPPSFFKMPADATHAVFSRGFNPAMLDKPRALLFAMLSEFAGMTQLPAADVKAAIDIASKYALPMSYASASGVDLTALEKAIDAEAAAAEKDHTKMQKVRTEESFGWRVAVIDEPVARHATLLKDASQWLARPAVQKMLKDLSKGGKAFGVTFKNAPTGKSLGLPKDTVHYQLVVRIPDSDGSFEPSRAPSPPRMKAPKAKTPSMRDVTAHVFLAPDGGKTVVGLALREDIAAKRMRILLGTEPGAATLEKRAGIEALKTARMHSGGFYTVGAFATQMLSPMFLGERVSKEKKLFGKLMAERAALEVPMIVTTHANMPDGAATQGSYSLSMRVPRDVIALGIRAALRGGFRH